MSTYIVGSLLVDEDELLAKHASGEIPAFLSQAECGGGEALEIAGGRVTASDLRPNTGTAAGAPQYTPIGIGKPLSIEIMTIYTGDAPSRGLLGLSGDADLLVTSGVKAAETYEATARAINFLYRRIRDRHYLTSPGFERGCPIVYYSPSLTDATVRCTFELKTGAYDDGLIDHVGGLFAEAAMLPIFAPAASFLLVGSAVLNILGGLSDALSSTDRPYLAYSMDLRFDTPPFSTGIARGMFMANEEDMAELAGYEVGIVRLPNGDERMSLVQKGSGREYAGDAPYMIVNFDGRVRRELEGFAPLAASTALMEKFYGAADRKVIAELGAAMSLYNDFRFREKAMAAASVMTRHPAGSSEYAGAKQLFDAYARNIREEALREK